MTDTAAAPSAANPLLSTASLPDFAAIDDARLPLDGRMIERLEAAWAANPVEPI